MPKRVLDGDAMWASTKLSRCPEWMIPEYSWLYPLADSYGSFEITNLRVIWGKISAIRPNFSLEDLQKVIAAFNANGLLFIWEQDGKMFGHWTNSDRPGRLPKPSRRKMEKVLAPPVSATKLKEYFTALNEGGSLPQNGPYAFAFAFALAPAFALAARSPENGSRANTEESNARVQPQETPQTSQSNDFDVFWKEYPKKIGEKRARQSWDALGLDGHLGEILASLMTWKASHEWRHETYIHAAANWLNQGLWGETPTKGALGGKQSSIDPNGRTQRNIEAARRARDRMDAAIS